MAGGRWRRYEHGVLLAGRLGLRSGCRRLSPWGLREFGQRPLRWVCHRGRSDVTPARSHGGDPRRSCPGRAPCPCLAPRTVDDTRATYSRRVCTRSGRGQRAASGAYKGTSVFSERPPARVAVLCGLGFRNDARSRWRAVRGKITRGNSWGVLVSLHTHGTHKGRSRGISLGASLGAGLGA